MTMAIHYIYVLLITVPVRTTDELGNKHTTKISTGPTSTILVVPKCYEDMDTSNCPASCPTGLYCDGQKCVKKSECTCKIEGKIVRVGNSNISKV